MGIMDRIFGGGKVNIPPRHRSGGFGNLALGILATQNGIGVAAWDTAPTNLVALTDEVRNTHLTQDGIDAGNDQVYIEVDLGRVCEVYEINIDNINVAGQGFMKAAGAVNDIFLVTGIDGETAATGDVRAIQVLAGDGDWYNSTLRYMGNGIPVRYVWLTFTGDGVNAINVDISEIQALGC